MNRAAQITDRPLPMRGRHRPRLLSIVRLAWGFSLLRLTASNATGSLNGVQDDRPLQLFTRILGFRHITEALVLVAVPSRRAIRAGSVVDTIHAATMLGLAGINRQRRDFALAHAAIAACWAIAADTVGLEMPCRDGGLR